MSHPRSRAARALLGLALLASAALALLLLPGGDAAPRAASRKRPEAPADAESARAWAAFVRDGALRAGDRAGYDFEFEREHRVAMRATADAEPQALRVQTRFSGRLLLTVLCRDGRGAVVAFSVRDVRLSAGSPRTPLASGDARLSMPGQVLARLDRRGCVTGVAFPEGLDGDARNHWREVLAHWQVALPEDPDASEWTLVEEDSSGEYEATYSLALHGDAITLRKTRGPYRTFRTGEGEEIAAAVTAGGSSIIELDGLVRGIRGEEQVRIDGSGGGVEVESRATFEFTRVALERGAAPEPEAARAFETARTTTLSSPDRGPEERAESFADLLARLVNPETAEDPELLPALSMAFRDAAAVEEALRVLRDLGTDERVCSALLCALAASQSEAGQRAIEEILLRGDLPRERRRAAVASLALVDAPAAGLEESLRTLFERREEDLSPSALLLLGAVGDKVRAAAPGRAGAIDDYLAAVLSHAARDGEEWMVALEALGNLGPAATPEAVLDAYRRGEPEVRAAALRAVLRIRDLASEKLLGEALLGDPSESVRLAAVTVIAKSKGGRGGLRKALERAAREDESEDVRTAARKALSAL